MYSTEQKYFGLGKESTRGTPVAPTKYIPVEKASELEYKLNLIEDDLLRGNFHKYSSYPGSLEGNGKLSGIFLQSNNCCELFLSLLGSVNTVEMETGIYKHTFTRNNSILTPSYTFHVDRGIGKKMYSLGVVKTAIFTSNIDDVVKAEFNILFTKEEENTFQLNPTWSDPSPFVFYSNIIRIANTTALNFKNWNLTIDNGAVFYKVQTGKQFPDNIVCPGKLAITGGADVYFLDEDERLKFLQGTKTSLEISCFGAGISGGYSHRIIIKLPVVKYTAYPFADLDGLLGASIAFEGYCDAANANSIIIEVFNTESSY